MCVYTHPNVRSFFRCIRIHQVKPFSVLHIKFLQMKVTHDPLLCLSAFWTPSLQVSTGARSYVHTWCGIYMYVGIWQGLWRHGLLANTIAIGLSGGQITLITLKTPSFIHTPLVSSASTPGLLILSLALSPSLLLSRPWSASSVSKPVIITRSS